MHFHESPNFKKHINKALKPIYSFFTKKNDEFDSVKRTIKELLEDVTFLESIPLYVEYILISFMQLAVCFIWQLACVVSLLYHAVKFCCDKIQAELMQSTELKINEIEMKT